MFIDPVIAFMPAIIVSFVTFILVVWLSPNKIIDQNPQKVK